MSKIQVFVRLRPVFYKENEEPEETCIKTSSTSSLEMVNLRNIKETLKFKFQQVFDEDSSQEEVFGTVVPPILSRYTDDLQNVSIFAYGPTGSGKTYTILGNDEAPGFIPRTMRHLFARIRQSVAPDQADATLTMSYLEIYQEKVYDLLANSKKLETIRQDANGCICVSGLTESPITTFREFEELFVPASDTRRVEQTKVNERSSRSHSLLIIKLVTQERKEPYRKRTAKLSIIDLAGSEDNRLTGNKGMRLKESSAINSSLHVLGKVVNALVQKQSRIPYRDSKLTRLLQDSLGGSAHTCIMVNVSPEMSSIFDTHRALTFAVASKSVINRPFTRESIGGPPSTPSLDRPLHNRKSIPCQPIFSPAIRLEAKKRSMPLDHFDDLGNLIPDSKLRSQDGCKSSRDLRSQSDLIDEIRNSTKLFKMLQQHPKIKTVETPSAVKHVPNNPSLNPEFNAKQQIVVKENNEKYTVMTINMNP